MPPEALGKSSHKRKMAFVRILLIGVFVFFGINSYAQNYIPESSSAITTAEVILEYSFEAGANRPWARFTFRDGFEIQLNAVDEGDYPWSIRVSEEDHILNLGSLKMEFYDNQNYIIVTTKINNNKKYKRYLDLLPGKYIKVK
jgi:hypothetical protein